jgi:hypothetical protein
VGVSLPVGGALEDEDLHPGEAAHLDIVPRRRLRCDERELVDRPCHMRSRARSSPWSVSLHRARCLSNQRLVLDSGGGGTEVDGAVGELGVAGVDVAANVALAVVSKRLGHSSIALTADTCSYLLRC